MPYSETVLFLSVNSVNLAKDGPEALSITQFVQQSHEGRLRGPAREPLCDDKPTKTPLGNQLHGWKIPQWQAMDCEGHLVVPQTRFFILRERGKVQQGKSNPENESI